MIPHRHEGDGEHIFIDKDGIQWICSQGYSQQAGKIPPQHSCPDCDALRKQGYKGLDGFDVSTNKKNINMILNDKDKETILNIAEKIIILDCGNHGGNWRLPCQTCCKFERETFEKLKQAIAGMHVDYHKRLDHDKRDGNKPIR